MADDKYTFFAVYYPFAAAKVRLPLGLPAGRGCSTSPYGSVYYTHIYPMFTNKVKDRNLKPYISIILYRPFPGSKA